jgi:hypothetical protein
MRFTIRKRRLMKLAIAGCAVLAVAAPATLAYPTTEAAAPQDVFERAVTRGPQPLSLSPDDRRITHGAGPETMPAPLDVFERAVTRGPQAVPLSSDDRRISHGAGPTPPPSVSSPTSVVNSFNWGDALVGGGTGIGILLLLGCAAAFGVRRRGSLRSA